MNYSNSYFYNLREDLLEEYDSDYAAIQSQFGATIDEEDECHYPYYMDDIYSGQVGTISTWASIL